MCLYLTVCFCFTEFEPIKQQLQDELNSTLRRRQNGQQGKKPNFVVPKNSTINAIYNQLNELDNQKAVAALAEPNYDRYNIEQPDSIPSRNMEPIFNTASISRNVLPPTTYNNISNNPLQQFQNIGTLPRSTISPNRSVDEAKPKLLITHGKPNFVRPSVPTLRPKLQDSQPISDRPESNDITKTLRCLKSVEPSDLGNGDEPTANTYESTAKCVPAVETIDNFSQNVIRNNVTNNNAPRKPFFNQNNVNNNNNTNNNVIFNNTNPRNSPINGGSPFVTRKNQASPALPTKPETALNDSQYKNNGLPNFIRKLDPTDITDDMQLSEDIFQTHARLNNGDPNNIVYVPQGLPFKMVLNSTPISRNTAPLTEKPQYLQKSPPITNQPNAFNFGNPVPRSPSTSTGSITPPELNAKKSASTASKHIVDQLQTLRKVDLKGDSSWMNKNNHVSPPVDEPTAILAKEAVPFQSGAVPHNPTITPPMTIHHLSKFDNNNSSGANFDIRNMTSFAKDLMDAPNRYPDTVVVTNNKRHVDENGRVINETTFSRKVVSSGSNGSAPEDPTKFFSNLKFVIEENGDIRPNLTQLSH